VLSWLEISFSRVEKIKIVGPLAHMAKTTRDRVELVVSLLTLPLIRIFSNAIDVSKLGRSKDFVELNYKRVT